MLYDSGTENAKGDYEEVIRGSKLSLHCNSNADCTRAKCASIGCTKMCMYW